MSASGNPEAVFFCPCGERAAEGVGPYEGRGKRRAAGSRPYGGAFLCPEAEISVPQGGFPPQGPFTNGPFARREHASAGDS